MSYWWLDTKWLVLAFLLIVGALVWKLRREDGIWWRRENRPAGRYEDCSQCGGMGMLKFPERRAFNAYEREHWTLEQMKANAIQCQFCGGLERVFKPD